MKQENTLPRLIVKEDDYGMAFYRPDGSRFLYHQHGNCPLTFLEYLGKELGFEIEYKGVMTERESESWC